MLFFYETFAHSGVDKKATNEARGKGYILAFYIFIQQHSGGHELFVNIIKKAGAGWQHF